MPQFTSNKISFLSYLESSFSCLQPNTLIVEETKTQNSNLLCVLFINVKFVHVRDNVKYFGDIVLQSEKPRLKSLLLPLLDVCPYVSFVILLYLTSPICKMTITLPTLSWIRNHRSHIYCEDLDITYASLLFSPAITLTFFFF